MPDICVLEIELAPASDKVADTRLTEMNDKVKIIPIEVVKIVYINGLIFCPRLEYKIRVGRKRRGYQ